jgi:hypothetical protein
MLCVPTRVRAAPDDPEMARALCGLLVELRRRELTDGSDITQTHRGVRWQYLCSMPFRNDNGSLAYLHLFHHACHAATDGPLTLGIPASPSWWPDSSSEILSPRTSRPTARLRLVS